MGIKATMTRLSQFVKNYDDELWYHLEVENKVKKTHQLLGGCLALHKFYVPFQLR